MHLYEWEGQAGLTSQEKRVSGCISRRWRWGSGSTRAERYRRLGWGGGLGSWNVKDTDASDTYIFVAGVVGIEYTFDFPLQVSLDFRPEIGFSDVYDGFNADFGLSARYQF